MDENTKAKLKQLREYYYDEGYSLKWIDATEKNIRRLVAQEGLADMPSVAAIIEDAKKRISTINQIISFDEDLTMEDRKKLIAERKAHQFYLNRFEGRDIDKQFELVHKILDEEIERIKEK